MRDRSFIEFAEANRLKVKRDECNDQVIPGKLGDIWEYGPGSMAVTIYEILPKGREITKKKWTYCKRACLKVGMTLDVDCDREGTLLFDPENAEEVAVAIKVAKISRKRRVSEEEKQRLREMGEAFRNQSETSQEGEDGA